MSHLVDRILTHLKNGSPEEQQVAISQACLLFEKSLGRPNVGWDEEVAKEPVTADDVSRLRIALVVFVAEHLPPPPVASAVSALGVLCDPGLRDLFRRCVEIHCVYGSDTGVLYQAMIALDNLEEDIFPMEDGQGHASIAETERNLHLAVQYLKKLGKR